VNDHIELPEMVIDGVEKGRYRLLVGDVRRERRAAPALLFDLADRRVRRTGVAGRELRRMLASGGEGAAVAGAACLVCRRAESDPGARRRPASP
jgi:hypothetical protein